MDTLARQRLLDKIRKLLALAGNNPSEHEAASALARAQQLMAEHGLDTVDVATSTIKSAKASATTAQRPAEWEATLVSTIGLAFGVRPILTFEHSRSVWRYVGRWTFVGNDARVEVAIYALDVLRRQLQRAREAYIKTHLRRVRKAATKTARADVFCEGYVQAVRRLVTHVAMTPEERRAVDRFVDLTFGEMDQLDTRQRVETRRDHHHRDYYNGAADGRDARLHHGVGGSSARQALIA